MYRINFMRLTVKKYTQEVFTGERAKFAEKDSEFFGCVFEDGESPLKESGNLTLKDCIFKWKYPLWYCDGVSAERCTLYKDARAGIWYTNGIEMTDCIVEAPKNFRRVVGAKLKRVFFSNASETLWACKDIELDGVNARGDYFAMNCENLKVDGLYLDGNYSFDGVKNAVIRNSRMISRDAFWNSDNVTVYDSHISGEYLGWNAKNLTLINCTVESLQGMCYIENLKMINCKLIDTTLAFEYSSVDAQIVGKIDSVLNPKSGTITADEIGTLTIEKDRVDPSKTVIKINNGD